MRATDSLVLPADVRLTPVDTLGPGVRRRLQAEDGDWIISRRGYRNGSLLVGRDAVDFLRQFRTPQTVVAAVLAYRDRFGGTPDDTLTTVVPIVGRAHALSLLVEDGSVAAKEIRPSLQPGSRITGLRVQRCVHLLADVEVYRAVDRSGAACALKLLRPGAGPHALRSLEREAIVLERLNGTVAPRLLDHDAWHGRRCLVTRWCEGREVGEAARVLRGETGALSAPVLGLCTAVLGAYARLHAIGVLHGDVHTKNILVRDDGCVVLLDFASSSSTDPKGDLPSLGRVGVVEYLEPECARALARGAPLPVPTIAGEQYALAALCYALATGAHHFDFALLREEWLDQVRNQAPRSFRTLGLTAGEAIEQVLRRALSRRPADRYATVSAFARQLVRASRRVRAGPRLSAGAQAFLASVTSRLALRDGRIDSQLCEPPRCSLSYGASGLAYLLYRLAVLRADPALLSTADAWSSWAQAGAGRRDACECAELGITRTQVGSVSLHFRRPGIELVRALVSHAMGDWMSCNAALSAFLASTDRRCGNVDLTTGQSGVLLACAALLEALPTRDGLDRPAVEQHGRRLATRLAATLLRERVAQSTVMPWLGIAHGWAGVLFAALRWRQAVGVELPGLRERLRELADLAVWHRAAAAWQLRSGTRSEDCRPRTGWCHGGAGYVQLWVLADHVFPGDGYARFALGAASHLWTASQTGGSANGSLCCGYAGQAYALLTLFRWNGDRGWLIKAHAMLDRALARADDAERRHSLYKGDAGIALLAEELTHPASSRMPLFEEEGWPRAP